MKTVIDYLERLSEKHGSYYAVAKELGITQASISVIRKGGGVKDETAVKIAELLEIDPGEVLLAAAMARSQGAVRQAWESISKRAGIAAMVAMVAVLASGFSVDVEAAEKTGQFDSLYIMRSLRQ